MDEEIFQTSKNPKNIHYYNCYHDPSKINLINGLEYNEEWDEDTKRRWNFFYRPIPEYLGKPQNELIVDSQKLINTLKDDLSNLLNFMNLFTWSIVILILALYFNQYSKLPLSIAIIFFIFTYSKYKKIDFYENTIKDLKSSIKKLNEEIIYLKKQIPKPISEMDIEKEFKDELSGMEIESLNEILNEEVDKNTIKKYIEHESFDPDRVINGILIKSWAFLQPSQIYGSIGLEYTGLNRFYNEIKDKIFTWYEVDNTDSYIYPYFYRSWYIQYIYLLDKNISTYSFFYDFIKQKKYGIRSETFQYNHIANLSINKIELNKDNMITNKDEDELLIKEFTSNEVHTFTLSATSNMHFRCVFIDNSIVASVVKWEEEQEKEYTREKKINIEQHKKSIDKNLHTAYKALNYIRNGIDKSSIK